MMVVSGPMVSSTTEGAEVTLAAMDEYSRANIGKKTYDFVRRAMRNPEYRKLIEKKEAELRAAGYFD